MKSKSEISSSAMLPLFLHMERSEEELSFDGLEVRT